MLSLLKKNCTNITACIVVLLIKKKKRGGGPWSKVAVNEVDIYSIGVSWNAVVGLGLAWSWNELRSWNGFLCCCDCVWQNWMCEQTLESAMLKSHCHHHHQSPSGKTWLFIVTSSWLCYIFGLFLMPTICRLSLGLPCFLYLDPFTKASTLFIVPLHRDCCYLLYDMICLWSLCTIQVWLSLADGHLLLLSLTYYFAAMMRSI